MTTPIVHYNQFTAGVTEFYSGKEVRVAMAQKEHFSMAIKAGFLSKGIINYAYIKIPSVNIIKFRLLSLDFST